MTRLLLLLPIGFFAITVMVASSVNASEPRLIKKHGAWDSYSFTENGSKVCHMAATPQTRVGNYTSRGDTFALITHRPSEKTTNVFSYITGYPYKEGSEVTIQVNGGTYKLFTQGDTAWAADAAADKALARAVSQGSTMIVKGTSKRGTLTTDTFSLKGSGGAYKEISTACGI